MSIRIKEGMMDLSFISLLFNLRMSARCSWLYLLSQSIWRSKAMCITYQSLAWTELVKPFNLLDYYFFFLNFLSGHLRWGRRTRRRRSVTIKQLCLLPPNSFLWVAKMRCQFFQDGESVHGRGPLKGINLRLHCSFWMRRSATICHELVNRCKQAEVFGVFFFSSSYDESFLKKTWKPPQWKQFRVRLLQLLSHFSHYLHKLHLIGF